MNLDWITGWMGAKAPIVLGTAKATTRKQVGFMLDDFVWNYFTKNQSLLVLWKNKLIDQPDV
jgi:hypothetical protein